MLFSFLNTFYLGITRINRTLANAAAGLTVLMAVTTSAVVLQRVVLSSGSIALQDSVTYMHAIVIALCCAFTLHAEGHVRVDIFYRKRSPEQKAWVNAVGTALFLLPFCLYITWVSWDYVANAWRIKEVSQDASGLPFVYLQKSLILVCGLLLSLQGLAQLCKHLVELTLKNEQ